MPETYNPMKSAEISAEHNYNGLKTGERRKAIPRIVRALSRRTVF